MFSLQRKTLQAPNSAFTMQHRFAGLFLFLLKLFFTEIQGSQFPFPLGGGGGNGNSKGLINEGQTVDYPSGVPAKNCTEACLIKRQNTKNSRIEKIKLQILKGLKDSDEGFTGREDHPRLWVNNYTATTGQFHFRFSLPIGFNEYISALYIS